MLDSAGSALLWVVYGGYIKALTKKNNEEHIEGKYFSILNSICFGNSLLGNLITAFGLGLFSIKIYFLILTFLGIVDYMIVAFLI